MVTTKFPPLKAMSVISWDKFKSYIISSSPSIGLIKIIGSPGWISYGELTPKAVRVTSSIGFSILPVVVKSATSTLNAVLFSPVNVCV